MGDNDRSTEETAAEVEELRAELGEWQQRADGMFAEAERLAQLEAVWREMSVGIITITTDGIIQDVNPAAGEMLGYDREELLGQNVKILVPEPHRQQHDGYLAAFRSTGSHHIIGVDRELMAVRKDGSTVPIEATVIDVCIRGKRTFTGMIYDASRHAERASDLRDLYERDLQELSTPCIRIWDGIITSPIIGTLDSARGQQLMEALLTAIVETRSQVAILDITGVTAMDTHTAAQLIKTVHAVQLLGCRSIVTGIRKEIAQTLVELGEVGLDSIETKASMMDGILSALEHLGLRIVRAESPGLGAPASGR